MSAISSGTAPSDVGFDSSGGAPPPRRRPGGVPVWVWVLIGVGALTSVAIASIGIFAAVGLNQLLTHDLLHENFSTAEGSFPVGTHLDHSFAVEDGSYVITSLEADAGGAFAYATLARKAFALTAEVDVVSMSGSDPMFVGIACAAPGAVDGYYLIVDRSGTGAILIRMDPRPIDEISPLAVDESITAGTVESLRLDCVDEPLGTAVALTGYVNGELVLTARDEAGMDGFDTVVLHTSSAAAGDRVGFDNVDVVVPGGEAED